MSKAEEVVNLVKDIIDFEEQGKHLEAKYQELPEIKKASDLRSQLDEVEKQLVEHETTKALVIIKKAIVEKRAKLEILLDNQSVQKKDQSVHTPQDKCFGKVYPKKDKYFGKAYPKTSISGRILTVLRSTHDPMNLKEIRSQDSSLPGKQRISANCYNLQKRGFVKKIDAQTWQAT